MSEEQIDESITPALETPEIKTESPPETPPNPEEVLPIAAKKGASPKTETLPDDIGNKKPAYTPNYKFNFTDGTGKKQEAEIEEWARAFIKSKDDEEKFRTLYAKSHGMDSFKSRLEQARGEFTEVANEYSGLRTGIDQLKKYVEAKDFDEFFKSVNIPNEWIYEWVRNKVQYQNLPPDQKKVYDDTISARRRAQELERDSQTYQTQYQEAVTRNKELELDMVLSKPDINSMVQEYDRSNGRIGAFRDQVAIQAYALESMTGKNVSAQEAVDNLLRLMGRGMNQPPVQAGANQPPVVSQGEKPIIPNIKARGSSPVAKRPANLAEMRRQIQERFDQASEN